MSQVIQIKEGDEADNPKYQQMITTTGVEQKDGSFRIININAAQNVKYCSNKISTAKYNVFTFIPKFFYEQFRKYANIFFLLIALIQQVPNVSPTGRFTTAGPLAFILTISAIKEIVEDYKRHKADDKTNKSKALVLKNEQWVEVMWQNMQIGNIVKLHSGQSIPADMVILASSEPHAMCYIETSNLDGETNLKLRQGSPQTSHLLTIQKLITLNGPLECELPNRQIYEFNGSIDISNEMKVPLNTDQLLLRGSVLKNTRWVFGVIVYTGHESKVMLNSTSPPLKRSTVERKTNYFILALVVILLFLTLFTSISNIIWTKKYEKTAWYLGFDILGTGNIGLMVMTCFIMFHTIIPISLQVSLEVVRFLQAYFINWDLEMYCKESNTPATARTSNLNEELGQVKYVFSDKTGTLTRNIMEFKRCSVAGKIYGNKDIITVDEKLKLDIQNQETMVEYFFRALALCHTVVPEQDSKTNEITYQASSPDENALVKAARQYGFVFHTRTPNAVTISVNGNDESYKVLNVLEFTSTRKRMSVILERSDGKLIIFCKGADNVIFERLGNSNNREITENHLEEFAKCGLRTLCVAYAYIDKQFYDQWSVQFHKASIMINNREEELEKVAELIEKNFILIGATAIEDKLQYQVPETIANLAKAGIKIWVLTGDKMETAINIGHSANLLTESMTHLTLVGNSLDETRKTLKNLMNDFGDTLGKENDVGLIVGGDTLKFALTCDCKMDFLQIALSCKAVICCRVSPLQKAEIVALVRENKKDSVTLAIGDGANDVGMIQAAHVGVGISGLEGLQAACSSDYAIAQFRFLNRLLLVHGAWNYNRLTKLILYSFYKNVCFFVIQFWFALYSGFSGQILFERWSIGLYNVIFTALPPFALGLFDRSCSAENSLKYPQLYKEYQENTYFNWKVFGSWVLNSIFQSILLFWLTVESTSHDILFSDGKTGSLLFLGCMLYTYVIVTVCVKAGIEHVAWTWMSHIAIWGSIISWFGFFVLYSHFFDLMGIAANMARLYQMVFISPIFWLGLILIPTTVLTRDIAWKAIKRTLFESLRERVMQMERKHEDPGKIIPQAEIKRFIPKKLRKNPFRKTKPNEPTDPVFDGTQFCEYPVMRGNAGNQPERKSIKSNGERISSGYAFSQEEHGVISQSQLIREYDSRQVKPKGF